MPAEAVLARELRALRAELSASRRARPAEAKPASTDEAAGGAVARATASPPAIPPKPGEDEQQVREQLSEFAGEITEFFEQAQQNISAHPIESVAGALLIGILIGRLLGRR